MPDYVRRAIRGFLWSFLGTVISSGLLSSVAAEGVVDWSVVTKVMVSAVAAGVTGVITFAVNALEDHGTIPALLKAPASGGARPAPPDGEL